MSPAGRRGERPAAEKINSLSLFPAFVQGPRPKGKEGKDTLTLTHPIYEARPIQTVCTGYM